MINNQIISTIKLYLSVRISIVAFTMSSLSKLTQILYKSTNVEKRKKYSKRRPGSDHEYTFVSMFFSTSVHGLLDVEYIF